MLEMAAPSGEIDLFYTDESGCGLWGPVSYSYYFRGRQKRQEQTKKRGKRVSILGLWRPFVTFVYALVLGGFVSQDYIVMMNIQAKEAAQEYEKTGRFRVIVQDNGPIHKSKAVRQKWSEWEAQNLYMFFLPAYCSEINPIEGEWAHLKRDELAGQMFEGESELAYNIVEGLEARGEKLGHSTHFVDVKANVNLA